MSSKSNKEYFALTLKWHQTQTLPVVHSVDSEPKTDSSFNLYYQELVKFRHFYLQSNVHCSFRTENDKSMRFEIKKFT
jgi:hypothetical protein